MNRREFIIASIGSGFVLLPFSKDLKYIYGMSKSVSDPILNTKIDPRIHKKISIQELELLSLASRAPSGHNTQPWEIKVKDAGKWEIHLHIERILPAVDPFNRESLLSIGAFMEALFLSGQTQNYQISYQLSQGESKIIHPGKIADITLKKTSKIQVDALKLRKKILSRRTVKSNILDREISNLNSIVKPYSNNLHFFPMQSSAGKVIADLTVEANRIQTYRDDAQIELSRWIRWSDRENKKFRNGLSPAALEINGIAGWYVRNFYSNKDVLKKAFRKSTIEKIQKQVKQGAGWFLWESPDSSQKSIIETGRRFFRFSLTLREKNIAMHPMSQLLEEATCRRKLENFLQVKDKKLQFVLRCGYVEKYPNPVSLRMPPARFLTL